ncbi:hypothetical protein SLEP1_g33416 [Rubroshorea leprosula]|uniref:TF-B3 domain-containing protein n=1 Tax=Rubroshorea leprosula TaxID=152421 RepID=A0AAV5KGJ0_9ROSI|nr:hypothetical protein SLEP1_g33416 [Rubroshorea leprosula]
MVKFRALCTCETRLISVRRLLHPWIWVLERYKKVEKNIENGMSFPNDSHSLWGELPPLSGKLEVKDEQNTTWSFDYSTKNGKPYLSGVGWRNFVQSRGIKAGNINMITLYKKDDPFRPGDTFYEIKLSN